MQEGMMWQAAGMVSSQTKGLVLAGVAALWTRLL